MFNMDHCGEKNAGWELRTAGAVQENGPGKRRPGDKEQGQGAEKKGQKADTIGEQIGKSTLSLCVFAKGFRQGLTSIKPMPAWFERLVHSMMPADLKPRPWTRKAASTPSPAWAQPGR
jgi:hypothetical protein